jgi:toxin HigB-1
VIRSFACKDTEALFKTGRSRRFGQIAKVACRKLDLVDGAASMNDLRVPPGNRLEALSGGRKGQYSIRINDQWRICFVWRDGQPDDIEIVDYH